MRAAEEMFKGFISGATARAAVTVELALIPVVTDGKPPVHELTDANDSRNSVFRTNTANCCPINIVKDIFADIQTGADITVHRWGNRGEMN